MSTTARTLLIVLSVALLTLCGCTAALLSAGVAWYAMALPASQCATQPAAASVEWSEDAPAVWFELRAEGRTLVCSAEPVRADADYCSVGWVILADGKQILHRNAENETRYDLYRSVEGADITAYVVVWSDGAYRRDSQVVAVDCQ